MIILDYQDRRPIYEQITEKFRTLIYQGALPAGCRLPSVRQLAMELSINPNTIQRAYMTLEQEGMIYPVKGKGNFVAETQQIQENRTAENGYYTVKAGDPLWDLGAAPHAPYPTKTYGFTCSDVIARNPQAFSISGDPTSMQVGARLWVGNRRK